MKHETDKVMLEMAAMMADANIAPDLRADGAEAVIARDSLAFREPGLPLLPAPLRHLDQLKL
jgi:hypothetical protein